MAHASTVYIGIGSNLGEPVQQVIDVLPLLDGITSTCLRTHSSLYKTAALSDIEQKDYINAVARLETSLTPTALLLELQAIEQAFYRQRDEHIKWGPRTMDLDILLFDALQMNDSHLILPHPEIQNRRFVLEPLLEIARDIYLPGLGSLSYLLTQAPPLRVRKLDTIAPRK
jgi:2-amino-4-hydroxy-6-hydroxymethyldihydropteridine diphosphokinase